MGNTITTLSMMSLGIYVTQSGSSYSSSGSSSSYGGCDDYYRELPNHGTSAHRIYSIACVEEVWDYAPSGKNLISGNSIDNDEAGTWLYGNGRTRIGRRYIKAMYRGFTNNCFSKKQATTKKWAHLGMLGPVIRAVQGETVKIFFKNMCSQPYSMHPHGMEYDKTSEGAPYADGTSLGDVVQPGQSYIYVWNARKSMVDKGASSKMWLYHSHVDEVADITAGLIGPIIITKAGYQRSSTDLMPKDVTREYVTMFMMIDENTSPYFQSNIDRYLNFDSSDSADDIDYMLNYDLQFRESNLMHSINGYLFGNLQGLTCTGGEYVRWHTAALGNELDGPHSPHWHGNVVVTSYGANKDSLSILPGTTETVTMKIDAFGKWLYHCHVHDHITAGMVTTYTSDPFSKSSSSAYASSSSSSSSKSYSASSSSSDSSSSSNRGLGYRFARRHSSS